jgi:hypothetical protein
MECRRNGRRASKEEVEAAAAAAAAAAAPALAPAASASASNKQGAALPAEDEITEEITESVAETSLVPAQDEPASTLGQESVIESRWVSEPPAFAGKLRPRRLNS